MLHILWLIVKFILIVLGGLMGILLLAVFLILFCPVRYRAEVRKDQPDWKRTEGEAGVSWLFHGISVKVWRKKEETDFSVRILGISIDKFLKKKEGELEKPEKPENNSAEIENPESAADVNETEKTQETVDIPEKSDSEPALDTSENKTENAQKKEWGPGLFKRLSDKLTEIRSKISNIGLTFHKIHDKIEWWKKFIHHPRTQEAISLVWKHGKFLIRHILPTKVNGQVVFGCENPAVTGQLLGVLGMTIPFHKNCIAVTPLFDGENRVEGNVKVRGRIYGIVLLRAVIVIYFNKNVKYVIKRMKRGNHKEG